MAIVEDDAEVRVALTRLLSSAGYATKTFASGAEFLISLDDDVPECIVLDLHMPEVTGFQVQRQLLQRHPEVRVVVITGHDTTDARDRALTLGARAYLSKPVDGEALLVAISGPIDR